MRFIIINKIQIFNPTLKEMLVIFIFSLQDGKNKTILKA